MFMRLLRGFQAICIASLIAATLQFSDPPTTDQIEQIRAFTRKIEFDYINWTLGAALLKIQAASVGLPYTLKSADQNAIVGQYLDVTRNILEREYQLEELFASAAIVDKERAAVPLRSQINSLKARQADLAPVAEAVLQGQVSQVLEDLDLASVGQPIPPVLYHISALPLALIVSQRARIEQIANLSVQTDLDIYQQNALERSVDQGLGVSSLVVEIGGVGVYPTMVMRTTDLKWLIETISHEWTHNYLTLRPLGMLYDATPELRMMNETTASIAGTEIGAQVIARFYPELGSKLDAALGNQSENGINLIAFSLDNPDPGETPPPVFDFRAEMHETRVTADTLLADGKVDEAEAYMEKRRLVFVRNGYLLRKINQAYFSFYGAYADVPGGAAGEDPVGPAVRSLRAQSPSLSDFINQISWMTDFTQLQAAVK